MRRLLGVVVAVSALMLAGCSTKTDVANRECTAEGYKPGTQDFARCYQAKIARGSIPAAAPSGPVPAVTPHPSALKAAPPVKKPCDPGDETPECKATKP